MVTRSAGSVSIQLKQVPVCPFAKENFVWQPFSSFTCGGLVLILHHFHFKNYLIPFTPVEGN